LGLASISDVLLKDTDLAALLLCLSVQIYSIMPISYVVKSHPLATIQAILTHFPENDS